MILPGCTYNKSWVVDPWSVIQLDWPPKLFITDCSSHTSVVNVWQLNPIVRYILEGRRFTCVVVGWRVRRISRACGRCCLGSVAQRVADVHFCHHCVVKQGVEPTTSFLSISKPYMVYQIFFFSPHASSIKNVVINLSAAIFIFILLFSGVGGVGGGRERRTRSRSMRNIRSLWLRKLLEA